MARIGGAMLRGKIDSHDARVSIRTLYEATQMIRRGALTNDVIMASYRVMDRKFNAYMSVQASGRSDLTHMFDWGMQGSNVGRLWQTRIAGQGSSKVVYFVFLPSKKKVPFDPELEGVLKRRHVFKRKAEVFENGEAINISPRYAKFLVYINRHRGAGTTDPAGKGFKRGNITFTTRTSVIERAANGMYQGRFTAEFLNFWNNIGTPTEVADELSKSTAVQMARAASSRKRLGQYQAKLSDPSPEAKAKAQRAITNIKKQMRGKK